MAKSKTATLQDASDFLRYVLELFGVFTVDDDLRVVEVMTGVPVELAVHGEKKFLKIVHPELKVGDNDFIILNPYQDLRTGNRIDQAWFFETQVRQLNIFAHIALKRAAQSILDGESCGTDMIPIFSDVAEKIKPDFITLMDDYVNPNEAPFFDFIYSHKERRIRLKTDILDPEWRAGHGKTVAKKGQWKIIDQVVRNMFGDIEIEDWNVVTKSQLVPRTVCTFRAIYEMIKLLQRPLLYLDRMPDLEMFKENLNNIPDFYSVTRIQSTNNPPAEEPNGTKLKPTKAPAKKPKRATKLKPTAGKKKAAAIEQVVPEAPKSRLLRTSSFNDTVMIDRRAPRKELTVGARAAWQNDQPTPVVHRNEAGMPLPPDMVSNPTAPGVDTTAQPATPAPKKPAGKQVIGEEELQAADAPFHDGQQVEEEPYIFSGPKLRSSKGPRLSAGGSALKPSSSRASMISNIGIRTGGTRSGGGLRFNRRIS